MPAVLCCACFVAAGMQGPAGLYKGVSSPLAGQMFFNAIQFLAYGQAKSLVQRDTKKKLTISQYFAAGAITGSRTAT